MLIAGLVELLGKSAVQIGGAVEERYRLDCTGTFRDSPLCVVRPESPELLAKTVRLCHDAGIAVVALGGHTGVVGGAMADGAVKLSLERLNKMAEVNVSGSTLLVDAGVTLQAAQEMAAAHGLYLPLDIGARGSATIGGVLATNAGGNHVLRWGMARDLVLGLEVVLPDGQLVSSLRQIVKDNAGYDWKHLFIGSEGTLGIITRAVLKLVPAPIGTHCAIVAVESLDEAIAALRTLKQQLGGTLSAFELMWNDFYVYVTQVHAGRRALPLPADFPLYCLVEASGTDPEHDRTVFENAMMSLLERGTVRDVVIAQSERDRLGLWSIREDLLEVVATFSRYLAFDVAMPLDRMDRFLSSTRRQITEEFPQAITLYYGHAGDGNLHIVVGFKEYWSGDDADIENIIYKNVNHIEGSISGEHGIGVLKREYLRYSRSESEINLMKTIKKALDPRNILNPDKILTGMDNV